MSEPFHLRRDTTQLLLFLIICPLSVILSKFFIKSSGPVWGQKLFTYTPRQLAVLTRVYFEFVRRVWPRALRIIFSVFNRRRVFLSTALIRTFPVFLPVPVRAQYSVKNLIRSVRLRKPQALRLSCTRFLTRSQNGSRTNFFVLTLSMKKNRQEAPSGLSSTLPKRRSP